jgi:uncharacterized DUF497 family protein
MAQQFTWDLTKAASNLRKHGVDFSEATRVFLDPFASTEQDRIEEGEYRWRTLGLVGGTVLFVAYTLFEEEDLDIIHIISARRAIRSERRQYEEERHRQIRT